ncbi:MAG: TRAP transporter small permease, partial [Alphaproteobacteria bacterium]|nr:TRAP transporter small permease [Alphaproteobacteria bacterium]
MRKLMIVSMVVTAALVLGLVIANLFFGAGIDLKQFLSPAQSSVVAATMIAGATALLAASIYLSDTRGMIEPEPAGFFDVVSLVCARLSMIATAIIVLVMFY